MGLEPEKFTIGFYYRTLNSMLRHPRAFFSKLSPDMGVLPPLGFLCLSGLIFMIARLTIVMPKRPLLWGGIWLANAVGMALVAAAVGYMAMVMILGRQVTFRRFFSVYALSVGVTLLASWLPFFFWITEPWKWWLIGLGLTSGLGFGSKHAWLIIVVSIAVIVLFFWSLLPVISNIPIGA